MRRFIIVLLSVIITSGGLSGQVTSSIRGVVRNASGKGVPDVNVFVSQVEQKYSVFASCLTDSYGRYSLSFTSYADSVCVNLSSLGIIPESAVIENRSQERDFIVEEMVQEIEQVVVRAPKVYSKGDTISYYVAAFQSRNDVTIGQVLRRLPGISVSDAVLLEMVTAHLLMNPGIHIRTSGNACVRLGN